MFTVAAFFASSRHEASESNIDLVDRDMRNSSVEL